MSKKLYWVIFSLILVLAVLTRVIFLGKIPVDTYWDETAILMDASSVAKTGHDVYGQPWWQLIYKSYGDYKAAPYIWLTVLTVKVLGVNAAAVRVVSMVAGVLTVIMVGKIVQALGGRKSWQLMSMLVVASSPWAIMFSRAGFEGHLAQLFLAISMWLLIIVCSKLSIKSVQNRRLFTLSKCIQLCIIVLISGALAGLATWTYFSVRFVAPVVALTIIFVYFWRQKERWGRFLLMTMVFLAPFLIMLLMVQKSPYYAASNQYRLSTSSILNNVELPAQIETEREVMGNDLWSKLIFNQKFAVMAMLLKNYAAHLDFNFLFVSGDSNLRHGTGQHGLFLWIFLPCFVVGLWQLFAGTLPAGRQEKSILLILVAWWLAALLPASVPMSVPHALRSLNALVPLSLIIGYGAVWILQQVWRLKNKKKYLLVSLASGLWLITFGQFLAYYFWVYPTLSAIDWQADYTELTKAIIGQRNTYSQVYVQNLDGRFWVWLLTDERLGKLDFDNLQFDQVKYGELPEIFSSGTLYVGEKNTMLARLQSELNSGYEWREIFEVHNYETQYVGVEIVDKQ